MSSNDLTGVTGATAAEVEAAAERRYYRWRGTAREYPPPPLWDEIDKSGWIKGATVDAMGLVPPGWRLVDPATVRAIESVLGCASRGERLFAADYEQVSAWLAAGWGG